MQPREVTLLRTSPYHFVVGVDVPDDVGDQTIDEAVCAATRKWLEDANTDELDSWLFTEHEDDIRVETTKWPEANFTITDGTLSECDSV